jgi:hypothetical protein
MRASGSLRRSFVAMIATGCMIVMPGGAVAPWITVATAAPVVYTAPAADGVWPRRNQTADGAIVVMYEPQVASWDNQKLLKLYAAVSYSPKGSNSPLLGTIVAEADTRVSVEERLVDFSSFRVVRSNFPNASREQAAAAVNAIKTSIPVEDRVLSLDRVLAYQDASKIRPNNVDGVKADPPAIFYSTRAAVIVNIDGPAVWSPIKDNELRFAVNTNWDLFEYPPTKTYYLRNGDAWLKSAALASGGWAPASTLPASFTRLPADDNWKDVRAALPGRQLTAASAPTVFVSTTPAEMIYVKGQPQYETVAGTKLLWVRNTDSDVFRLGATGAVYYLVAGRWFSAPDFTGPWTFATPSLPPDFQKIPLEHPRSRVLASVPGTVQAAEAVLLAQIPQTARVSKKDVKAPAVEYQGDPKFEPIEKTTVSRAVNTDKDIIKVGDLYYMCFQGVWFVSRSAGGPWEVTGSVPKQIYEIPISSPAHSVTYVTVEDDDDEWVVYATAAAYTGMMVAWGCAVWGSGWYYPPYIHYGGFYPAYFPYYPTYGYSAWYNPWTGAYGRGAAVYGPYGGAGVGARYNPRTGTYARGAAAYGPYGARGYAQAYNPRTGTYAATRRGAGVYGSWGATGVQRGDQWAATARRTSNVTGNTTRVTRGSGGGTAITTRGNQGGAIATSGGNVYAGRDGNVYRKQGGSWQQYGNGAWNSVAQPAPQARDQAASRPQGTAGVGTTQTSPRIDSGTINQLDRDAAARSDGAQRARDASTVRSGSSSTTRSGSYRPRGGGAAARPRSGGGRRR